MSENDLNKAIAAAEHEAYRREHKLPPFDKPEPVIEPLGPDSVELLPCPLEHGHPYGPPEIRQLTPTLWQVTCLTAVHAVKADGETREEAIERWNRRYAQCKAEERDFTPEEALAEARKRWGPDAEILLELGTHPGVPLYRVGLWDGKSEWIHNGQSKKSFRAAFAKADKESAQ